jgi:hypothetical protein
MVVAWCYKFNSIEYNSTGEIAVQDLELSLIP